MTDAARTTKRRYTTRAMFDLPGATEGCRGCAGAAKRHSTRCATRFDEIFAKQDEDRAARFPQAPAESAAEPQEAEAEARRRLRRLRQLLSRRPPGLRQQRSSSSS